jgi:hypothetical protein
VGEENFKTRESMGHRSIYTRIGASDHAWSMVLTDAHRDRWCCRRQPKRVNENLGYEKTSTLNKINDGYFLGKM